MKPELTYKQCENLKKWGLDQTVEEGDWIYWPDPYASAYQETLVTEILLTDSARLVEGHHYVKLPSAEEMIELLKTTADFYSLKTLFYLGAKEISLKIRLKPGLFRIFTRTDPSIGQALYTFCEKIFGERQ